MSVCVTLKAVKRFGLKAGGFMPNRLPSLSNKPKADPARNGRRPTTSVVSSSTTAYCCKPAPSLNPAGTIGVFVLTDMAEEKGGQYECKTTWGRKPTRNVIVRGSESAIVRISRLDGAARP